MIGSGQSRSQHQADYSVTDGKKILAEFNWNSAYEPYDYGCYWSNTAGGNPVNDYMPYPERHNLIYTPKGIGAQGTLNTAKSAGTTVSLGTGDTWATGLNSYIQVTVDTPGSLSASGWGLQVSTGYRMPINSYSNYACQVKVKTNSATGYYIDVYLETFTDQGVANRQIAVGSQTSLTSAGGWTTISGIIDERYIDATDTSARLIIKVSQTRIGGSAAVASDYVRITGMVLEAGDTVGSYFDGDTAATADSYSYWLGTANLSASKYQYKRTADETSGEPIDYDFISEYVDDAQATSYEAEITGKKTRYFSLYDCFMPNRPDAGIVYSRAVSAKNGERNNPLYYKTDQTRFYPGSRTAAFKYWNSAYSRKNTSAGVVTFVNSGVSDSSGYMTDVNPYVVYEKKYTPQRTDTYGDYFNNVYSSNPQNVQRNQLVINSIRFKMQTYAGTNISRKAKEFSIDVLPPDSDTWTEIYTTSAPSIPDSGVFQIWKNPSNGTWGTAEQNPTDMSDFNISTWNASNTFQLVRGVRLRMRRLEISGTKKAGIPFELIELAPLTTMDITDNVASVSIKKGFNDTDFGMPFGSINPDTGSITLQNIDDVAEDLNFYSNEAVLYGMSRNGFKLKTVFTLDNPNGTTDEIPLKEMYCFSNGSGDDFKLQFNLGDKLSTLSERDAPRIFTRNKSFSKCLEIFFDNLGITDYDFSDIKNTDGDTKLNYFFSTPESTAMDILEQLCKSVGAVVYEDEYGIMKAKTRQMIFGVDVDVVDYISDTEVEFDPLPEREAYFMYTASSTADVLAASDWWNGTSGNSGYIAYTSKVASRYAPHLKYRSCLNISRTSGSTLDYVSIQTGNVGNGVNSVIAPAHQGRTIEVSCLAKTLSGTSAARIGVTRYDKNKYSLGTTYGAIVNLDSSAFQQLTASLPITDTDTAYYGITIRVDSQSALSIASQFTEIMATTGVLANVKSYTIDTIDPISGGSIRYSPRGIFRGENNINKQDVLSSKRTLTEMRQQVWTPGQRDEPTPTEAVSESDEAVLGASILLKKLNKNKSLISSYSLMAATTEAEADTILDGYSECWMTLEGQSANSIVNHQGYVMINGEIIRYDGREFTYITDGTSKTVKIRSAEEYQNIRVLMGKDVIIYPTGRIRIFTRLKKNVRGFWTVSEVGRAQFGTTEREHDPDITFDVDWKLRGCVPAVNGYKNSSSYKPKASLSQKSVFGEKTFFSNCVITSAGTAGNPKYATACIGMVSRDMKRTMSRFGTRIRIQKTGNDSAGIVVGTTVGASSDLNGFYFQIKTTEAAGTNNNIRFYYLDTYGTGLIEQELWSGKYAIYPNSLNSVDNTINSTASESDQRGIYDLEVARSIRGDGKWVFHLFINGKKMADVVYKVSGNKFYSGAGAFVRGKSVAAIENFWAATGDTSSFKGQQSGPVSIDYGFNDLKRYGESSGALDKEFLNTRKYNIFYEEFGCIVREAKYYNAQYDKYPITKFRIKNDHKKEDRYAIVDIQSGSFGAEMLVVNLAKGTIDIGSNNSGSQNPLAIYGTVLSSLGERKLPIEQIINKTGKEDMRKRMRQAMRRLGKAVSVEVTGDFICTQEQAETLASFYIDQLTAERSRITAQVFGNPCYQIGDIVAARVMEQSADEWKKYVITSIDHDMSEGLTTSVTLREVDRIGKVDGHTI